MPGIGEEIDGAMQHAPQPLRQFMRRTNGGPRRMARRTEVRLPLNAYDDFAASTDRTGSSLGSVLSALGFENDMRTASVFLVLSFLSVGCSTTTTSIRSEANGLGPLHQTIARADRVVVSENPTPGAKVLFDSRDHRDIEALSRSLKLGPPADVHCMCIGSPVIRLYAGDKEIGSFTNHHAVLVRSAFWNSDVPIVDQEAYLRWFDERGIKGPREEVNYQREKSRQSEIAVNRWEENMPTSIRPIWRKLDQIMPERSQAAEALAVEIPDRNQRIMALFAWFGSGRGPWSGYPSYEGLPEGMLLDYPTTDLLAAIDTREGKLSDRELEGIARLFAGWDFSQKKKGEIKQVPKAFQTRLLAHTLDSTDPSVWWASDKIGRAKRAFGDAH